MPTLHHMPKLISDIPNIQILKNESIKILEENKTIFT